MAENILEIIAKAADERIARLKKHKSLAAVRSEAESLSSPISFKEALRQPGMSVIAELKKASPSKGMISEDFEKIYLQKARLYEEGGAAAISCLTEPEFFLGSDEYLRNVYAEVKIPLLRKDFTVAEYQIYEAKTIGASAVLLICGILSQEQLGEYLQLTHELGLDALVEAHTEQEVEAGLFAGAEIIGVNNRNLTDFSVNPLNSLRLRSQIPQGKIFVAESGITGAKDCEQLKQAGVDAVLIGEALMRAEDPRTMLKEIIGTEKF